MAKWTTNGLFPSFLSPSILLLSFVSFISSEILAEGTGLSSTPIDYTSSTTVEKAAQPTENTSGNKEKRTQDMEAAIIEELSTEAIWFGFEKEVAIATRHETPIGKAPSIVTVITAEEIKNLGYRTFVEILRTVPGFEILKMADFGDVVPAVRGLESANKVRVMINGHFINNPLRGGAFGNFDDFPVENIIKDNYVFMNYTFQNPEDNHGNDLPFVAQHKGNFGVNVHYWKYINTNLSSFVSGRRSREEGDPRGDLPVYALLNLFD